jgi:hypothetical protein
MTQTYNFTVTLTQAEYDSLSYVVAEHQDWIDTAVHERCRLAMEEIVQLAVQKCLANNIQIPGTKDDIVTLAFTQGWIKTGAQRNADALQSNNP